MTELAEKLMEEYGDELSRKTISIDIGIREIVAMIEDVKAGEYKGNLTWECRDCGNVNPHTLLKCVKCETVREMPDIIGL